MSLKNRSSRFGFFKKLALFLTLFTLCVLLFRKALLLFVLKIALQSSSGKEIYYEKIAWEEDQICIDGFKYQDHFLAMSTDRIAISFYTDLWHAYLEPRIHFERPHLLFLESPSNGSSSSPFIFLVPTDRVAVKLDMKEGILEFPSLQEGQFYFSFLSGKQKQQIGNFSLFSDPGEQPFFSLSLEREGGELGFAFDMCDLDLHQMRPLVSPGLHLDEAEGQVWMTGSGIVDKHFNLVALSCSGNLAQLKLVSEGKNFNIAFDRLEGDFSYLQDPEKKVFWEQLTSYLLLERGELSWKNIQLSELHAECQIKPEEDPQVALYGSILQDEKKFPLQVHGNGKVMEEDSFWLELAIDSLGSKEKKFQTTLSLCKPKEDQLIWQIDCARAGADYLELARKIASDFNPDWKQIQVLDGILQGKFTLEVKKDQLSSIRVDGLCIQRGHACFPESKITASAHSTQGQLLFARNENQVWEITESHVDLKGGHFLVSIDEATFYSASELELSCHLLDNEWQPSFAQGKVGGLLAQLDIHGKDAEHFLDLYLNGSSSQFVDLLAHSSKKVDFDTPCTLSLSLIEENGQRDWIGAMHVADEKVEFGFDWKRTSDMYGAFSQGWFRTEKISEKGYGPFLSRFIQGINLQGDLAFSGTFTPKKMQLSLQGQDLTLQHSLFSLGLAPLGQVGKLSFAYDVALNKWTGQIPIVDGQFYHHDLDLTISDLNTLLYIENGHIHLDRFEGDCQGLQMVGNLDLKLKSLDCFELDLATSSIEGSIPQLLQVLSHFPALDSSTSTDLQGYFVSKDKGLALHQIVTAEKNTCDWNFCGVFSQVKWPINAMSHIEEGSCEVQYDSILKRFVVQKGQGLWVLSHGPSYRIKLDQFDLTVGKTTQFDLKVHDSKREIGRIAGNVVSAESGWDVICNPQATHLLGTALQIEQMKLDGEGQLSFLQMQPVLKCQELVSQIQFLANCGVISTGALSLDELEQWQLQGNVAAKISVDGMGKGIYFSGESRDFKMKGKAVPYFSINGHKMGDRWTIDQLHFDDLRLKTQFKIEEKRLIFSAIEGSWGKIAYKGNGQFLFDQSLLKCQLSSLKGELSALVEKGLLSNKKSKGFFAAAANADWELPVGGRKSVIKGEATFSLDLHAPVILLAKTEAPIRFHYSPDEGMKTHAFSLQVYDSKSQRSLGSFKGSEFKQLAPSNLLEVKGSSFSLSTELVKTLTAAQLLPAFINDVRWQSRLEGTGDFSFGKELNFNIGLKDGKYGFKDNQFLLKQVALIYDNGILNSRFKTNVGEQSLWGIVQADLKGAPYGVFKVQESPKNEGIKALFKTVDGNLSWESIQGSLLGIDANLTKNGSYKTVPGTFLTGSVKVDGSRLDALFPKEMQEKFKQLKLGSGYEFQGNLNFLPQEKGSFRANGVLKGNQFELFGYRFDHLEAQVDVSPTHIFVGNLRIADRAGQFLLKKIDIDRQDTDQKWFFHIPLVHVKELRPSQMTKVGQASPTIKPLLVKNLTLTDIRGELGNVRSWEGIGKLNFTNQFKKEASLFDMPFEMLKNLGLDLGLLTPVQGALDIELHGDKFYLISLKDAYSEGKRSQFFLSPEDQVSYIDLDGKIHIDIRMRQEVVLKLTEAFTLTVRGTLDKPKYGLQY